MRVYGYICIELWGYAKTHPKIAQHILSIKPDATLVKQQRKRLNWKCKKQLKLKLKKNKSMQLHSQRTTLDKLANVYQSWKSGKVRVCIDFRKLNDACPKNDFPLPITDVMVKNICNFGRISFTNVFSGYNQI